MEVMVLLYLFHRVAYRFLSFFEHWYVSGFRLYWNFIIRSLQWFDRYFSGRALGSSFWFGRVLIGGIAYTLFLFVAAVVFLLWLLILPYVLIRIVV
ncbi:MAG: hypothetical protein AAB967_00515 [Patescibacteria group bacterium]